MKVIITGAAGGIGRAVGRIFATKPHDGTAAELLVADLDEGAVNSVVRELNELGAHAVGFVGDLADPKISARIVAQAEKSFGGIDVLVSNAGIMEAVPLANLTFEAYERTFAINTRATVLLGQAARPFLSRSRGVIVATASTAASHPLPPLGAYSASKAALLMFVRQMALEWGHEGIRCNCVSPGPTATPMTVSSYPNEESRRRRAAKIPVGRLGMPEDVAGAIHFLASPSASYISGVDLFVDGGISATLNGSALSGSHRTAE
jgi:NAD(P)-dependent dehydrogenase (short-subunit alcohol dehydrogenase family)